MIVPPKPRVTAFEWAILLGLSSLLVGATWRGWWKMPLTEVIGFATGGVCVWLVVRENILNWPIGLANNIAFFLLFLEARLFADMWLQVVYFGFGLFGWWNWLHGRRDLPELVPTRTRRGEWLGIAAFLVAGTWGMRELLLWANGAAPFWDAATTALCLAAQYLLCQKRIENWFLWIVADIIYVPLYLSRDLPLTAVLYASFLVMCIFGLRGWRRRLDESEPLAPAQLQPGLP